MTGHFSGASAAVGALFGVNGSKKIGNGDCSGRADLGAHHAADTAGRANLADNRALIAAGATYCHMILHGNHTDKQMRTRLGAGAAAGT